VVHLKDFSLVSPEIQSGDVLKAIEMAIPAMAIEQAIANTQTGEECLRSLPAQLVVSLLGYFFFKLFRTSRSNYETEIRY
jgi:hypothetical protein